MPTQPPLPSVLFGSAIQFMPISDDVDLKLKELREKYPTRRQVFSALDALDELKNTGNLLVNNVVGAADPLQANNLGVIPGSSTKIEISMPLLAVGPNSNGLNHSEHWKVLFASAETMGLTNFIASKLQGAPNTPVATGKLVLTPDLQAAIVDYYATPTPEALGTLIVGLALIYPYDAGIYEDVEQSYNLHMDLDGNVTVNQS
ncbi:hypothetical protein BJ165DRAFT_1399915 [Panaeolus papilionaceus]|nr:hypothetical protein BJ165DRAFT_1399915 [Panaeolus papilionaceus]